MSSTHWLNRIGGVLLGLASLRLILEGIGRPLPAPLILVLMAVTGAAGYFLSTRSPLPTAFWFVLPLLLLLVLWPWWSPSEFSFLFGLSGMVLAFASPAEWSLLSPRQADRLADIGTGGLPFLLYVLTLSRDLLPADSGEFQLVATLLGVAHPPGYPLYTMAGHLFIRLVPIGTPALRLNLMSAVLAAFTLLWIGRAARLWARRLGADPALARTGGVIAALALGSSTTFWAQATTANIRMPTLFFAALALYALARFATDRQDRHLTLLGLALGLGIGHHPSLAFIALFFVLYALLVDWRILHQPRRWIRPALAFLLGLLPLAYLPIQGARGAPLAPSDLDTLQGFLWHVTAKGFAGDMFAFVNPRDFLHRLALLPTLLTFQFIPLLLILMAAGALALLWRDPALALLLMGSWALHTYVTLTYRAPQTVEYMMPAYLPMALAAGLLPSALSPLLLRPSAPPLLRSTLGALTALALWAGLSNTAAHTSIVDLATDTSTRRTVESILETAPPNSLILADWHWATPMWYVQQVEGRRPDVDVEYVYPVAGEDYGATWLRRVQETGSDRPLLLTHFYDFPGISLEPWGAGFRVHPRPATETTAPLTHANIPFADGIRLVGYRLSSGPFRPGQTVEITLAWQRTAPSDRAPSFTLRLTDAEGREVAQADRYLGTDTVPGEVRWERLVLPLYPGLLPGRYALLLGAYTVTDAGFEPLPTDRGENFTPLAWLDVEPSRRAPFTLHPVHVPFAGGPALIGADYDRTAPDTLRLYLHWRGPTDGGTVRVRALGGGEATVALPPLPEGAYHTTVLDLPGTARGLLFISLTDPLGEVRQAAGPWGWAMKELPLPIPLGNVRFVPLGDAMAVVGVRSSPVLPGKETAVDVVLVGLRPLTDDIATSVRLTDETGRFLGAHDCQPALGMVPTLKWIGGSRVVDRHRIPIPADWGSGAVRATVVAYERFRLTPLPPMDNRWRDAVLLRP